MQPTCGDTKGRTALLSSVDNENADTKDNSGHSEGRLSCSGIIFTDQPCSENSAWSDDGVLGGSLSPLAECLKWNKGEGDVVLLFFFYFEVTARFYSHRPAWAFALPHDCQHPEWACEKRKKKKKEKVLRCAVLLFCPCGCKLLT